MLKVFIPNETFLTLRFMWCNLTPRFVLLPERQNKNISKLLVIFIYFSSDISLGSKLDVIIQFKI